MTTQDWLITEHVKWKNKDTHKHMMREQKQYIKAN